MLFFSMKKIQREKNTCSFSISFSQKKEEKREDARNNVGQLGHTYGWWRKIGSLEESQVDGDNEMAFFCFWTNPAAASFIRPDRGRIPQRAGGQQRGASQGPWGAGAAVRAGQERARGGRSGAGASKHARSALRDVRVRAAVAARSMRKRTGQPQGQGAVAALASGDWP